MARKPKPPTPPDLFDDPALMGGTAPPADRGHGRGLAPGPREGYPPTPTPPARPPPRRYKRHKTGL